MGNSIYTKFANNIHEVSRRAYRACDSIQVSYPLPRKIRGRCEAVGQQLAKTVTWIDQLEARLGKPDPEHADGASLEQALNESFARLSAESDFRLPGPETEASAPVSNKGADNVLEFLAPVLTTIQKLIQLETRLKTIELWGSNNSQQIRESQSSILIKLGQIVARIVGPLEEDPGIKFLDAAELLYGSKVKESIEFQASRPAATPA